MRRWCSGCWKSKFEYKIVSANQQFDWSSIIEDHNQYRIDYLVLKTNDLALRMHAEGNPPAFPPTWTRLSVAELLLILKDLAWWASNCSPSNFLARKVLGFWKPSTRSRTSPRTPFADARDYVVYTHDIGTCHVTGIRYGVSITYGSLAKGTPTGHTSGLW
jgi:hypothetical protein